MSIRLSADWMVKADERILEYLATEGPRTPSIIADDPRIRFSRSYINTRMAILRDAKLVRQAGRGLYQITDDGRAYLSGELDARELPDPTE